MRNKDSGKKKGNWEYKSHWDEKNKKTKMQLDRVKNIGQLKKCNFFFFIVLSLLSDDLFDRGLFQRHVPVFPFPWLSDDSEGGDAMWRCGRAMQRAHGQALELGLELD